MVGEELNAIAEAASAIEVSEIVKSAAILDTLATLQEAEAIKTAIAADVRAHPGHGRTDRGSGGRGSHRDPLAAGLLEARYLDALKLSAGGRRGRGVLR